MAIIKLFVAFFRIGMFSFGGGYAMLPLIYQAAQDFGFMSGTQFSELVALSQVTPGPVAINAATYVGYQYAGLAGAAAATAGIVTPSFILVYLVLHFLNRYRENRGLEGILSGIRPATIGLLCAAAVFLARESLLFTGSSAIAPFVLFAAALFAAGKLKMNPISLTLLGGVLGAIVIR